LFTAAKPPTFTTPLLEDLRQKKLAKQKNVSYFYHCSSLWFEPNLTSEVEREESRDLIDGRGTKTTIKRKKRKR